MTVHRPFTLIGVIIAGLLIAVILALQAIGSVLTRKEPHNAALVAPWNGLAVEQFAVQAFRSGVSDPAELTASAVNVRPIAQSAFARDPLTPKALALIALAQDDSQQKRQILEKAVVLNRRDLLLQGMLLEQKVADADYPGTLDALDRILRVNPQESQRFFPVLIQALAEDSALPALTSILDEGPVWQESFLQSALGDPEALPNLAKLRLTRGSVDPSFDERLIGALVNSDDLPRAFDVYRSATGGDAPTRLIKGSTIPWQSTFPPLDWQFVGEAGFRSQIASDQKNLELFIKGGNGGSFAKRIIPNPGGQFLLAFQHSLTPASQVKDARVEVRCSKSDTILAQQNFVIGQNRISVSSADCAFIEISLIGRAWSGRSPLGGTIEPMRLVRN